MPLLSSQPMLRNQSGGSSSFLTLPGEIRNQIINYCIIPTFKGTKSQQNGFKIAVYPRWDGPVSFKFEGIGPLPLFFVNKQVHSEVSSIIYGMLEEVSIGGYMIQFPNENPNARWQLAYTQLQRRPDVLRWAKNVRIVLPCTRGELFGRHLKSLGHMKSLNSQENTAWLMLPELENFLQTFAALSTLKVGMIADRNEPPDFNHLLSLYSAFKNLIAVEIIQPRFPGYHPALTQPWVENWKTAWQKFLEKVREEEM